MDSNEVRAEIHEGRELRSIPSCDIGLEHGRTESVTQPPPDEDSAVGGFSEDDHLVFGEDKEFLSFPTITEDEVRNALAKEVKKHKSWRMQAVKRMRIVNIETSMALRYTLDSFTETRSTFEVTEPYNGQPLDGFASFDGSGFQSNVWDVPCQPGQPFVEDVRQFEMPGTSNIQNCSTCSGQGSSHCFHCRGFGTARCNLCNGTGMKSGVPHPAVVTHPLIGGTYSHPSVSRTNSSGPAYALGTPMHFHSMAGLPPPGLTTMDLCVMCHGRGIKECYHCKGQGKKSCGLCGGSGKIRTYAKLKVKFGVQNDEYCHEMGIPEKIMKNVTGEIILAEVKAHVLPVKNFPIEAINDQSRRLIQIHLNNNIGRARILQQRHLLEAVPVAEVTFELNGRHNRFWVVGLERLAYIPQYPQKCTIL